ncbi:GGDEF domain-containing protein [Paenibacillus sp. FSL K6-1096]|uniref:GGDEF domain-containing protein n=1 Tax=Paenibacillus sp. FSL K6-1096 TaxID=2921460 RepID=UPI0030EE5C9A
MTNIPFYRIFKFLLFPIVRDGDRPSFSPTAFATRVSVCIVPIAILLYLLVITVAMQMGLVLYPFNALAVGTAITATLAFTISFTVTYINSVVFQKLLNSYDKSVHLSRTDPLTGLLNRKGVRDYVDSLPSHLDVAIIDIDKFKSINDAYGHAFGDTVIVNLAGILKAVSDKLGLCVGRLGGEEFVVISQQSMGKEFLPVCELLRSSVEASGVKCEALTVNYTISIGIAHGSYNESFSEVLHRADTALYKAKSLGRNRVVTA